MHEKKAEIRNAAEVYGHALERDNVCAECSEPLKAPDGHYHSRRARAHSGAEAICCKCGGHNNGKGSPIKNAPGEEPEDTSTAEAEAEAEAGAVEADAPESESEELEAEEPALGRPLGDADDADVALIIEGAQALQDGGAEKFGIEDMRRYCQSKERMIDWYRVRRLMQLSGRFEQVTKRFWRLT